LKDSRRFLSSESLDRQDGGYNQIKTADSHLPTAPKPGSNDENSSLPGLVLRSESDKLQIHDHNPTENVEDLKGCTSFEHHKHKQLWQERWNMALLVLLYMMQGVPLGLTTGAM
jgi:hypothetical protein